MASSITDFFNNSQYQMANISKKRPTFRRAVAMGRIYVGEVGFTHIKNGTLPKGDVLKLAEIAGVQGAKNAWQNIPMCHPLLLDHAAVLLELEPKTNSVTAYSSVSLTAKTGVEMEALAAVNAALLTLYDLTKPVEPALTISDVRLLLKEGGKKGLWVHPDGLPEHLSAALLNTPQTPLSGYSAATITLSDRAFSGEYEDRSGPTLKGLLEDLGCDVKDAIILPDDPVKLSAAMSELTGKVNLIVTTGGTGLSPRDITPQTISALDGIDIPGIGELLRASSAGHVPTTWLSRSLAAVIGNTLVIALPGSTGGVRDGIEALKGILPHALDHIADKKNLHCQASKPS
jgi:molybdenum cofactor biosynthesis protein MoaC